ncbi:MAG: hypothetical protein BJ554DRAFT_6715, partial [Olpidium bornovanus]
METTGSPSNTPRLAGTPAPSARNLALTSPPVPAHAARSSLPATSIAAAKRVRGPRKQCSPAEIAADKAAAAAHGPAGNPSHLPGRPVTPVPANPQIASAPSPAPEYEIPAKSNPEASVFHSTT